MKFSQHLSQKKNLVSIKSEILKSGLFLLDQEGKPIGIFKLRGENKELCKENRNVIPGITDLALRVMINKLNTAISEYLSGPPISVDFVKELQDGFGSSLVKLLKNYNLKEAELEPQYAKFKKKVNSQLKKLNKGFNPRKLRKQEIWFSYLITPLYAIFEKYLTDLKSKELQTNQSNIFHYIAHLLIACEIEKRDTKRGHKPVFEKIRKYAYRSDHIKYMGRAKPF